MRKIQFCFILSFLFSCNRIETGVSLNKTDIEYIQQLNLLDRDEKVYKFYSEYKNKVAGNFFTNKRIAKYWIDERDKSKNKNVFAFYEDIKSIDTIFNAGLTYCPYMSITKTDGTTFRVSVDGKKAEIKSFFEDALNIWRRHK